MFDAKITQEQGTGVLTLKGDLTLYTSEEIKKNLLPMISRYNNIQVRFTGGNETKIDLACLQLLCAAHKTLLNQGKSLVVVPPTENTANFLKMLDYGGFLLGDTATVHEKSYHTRGFVVQEAN